MAKDKEKKGQFVDASSWVMAELAKLGDDASLESQNKVWQEAYNKFPSMRNERRFANMQKEFQRLLPQAQSGGRLLADIYDYVVSNKDVRLSEEERKKLKPPSMPKSVDARLLDERVAQARLRESTAGADEQAVINRITDDTYEQDLTNAQIASGGQASTYGSYAQTAANRRARNRIAGRGAVTDAVSKAEARTDTLIGKRQDVKQRQYINDLMAAQMLERRYENDRRYVDDLGRSGRQSRRNALQNMVDPLANLATNLSVQANNRRQEVSPVSSDPLAGVSPLMSADQIEGIAGAMPEEVAPVYNPTDYTAIDTDADSLTRSFSQNNAIGDFYAPIMPQPSQNWLGQTQGDGYGTGVDVPIMNPDNIRGTWDRVDNPRRLRY